MVDVERADEQIQNVRASLKSLKSALADYPSASDKQSARERMAKIVGEVLRHARNLDVTVRGEGTRFEDFFTNVGDSLVSAQKVLDRQTREYLKEDPVQDALRPLDEHANMARLDGQVLDLDSVA